MRDNLPPIDKETQKKWIQMNEFQEKMKYFQLQTDLKYALWESIKDALVQDK